MALTKSDLDKLRATVREELASHLKSLANWISSENNPVVREIAAQVLAETMQLNARLARVERESALLPSRVDALERARAKNAGEGAPVAVGTNPPERHR